LSETFLGLFVDGWSFTKWPADEEKKGEKKGRGGGGNSFFRYYSTFPCWSKDVYLPNDTVQFPKFDSHSRETGGKEEKKRKKGEERGKKEKGKKTYSFSSFSSPTPFLP